MSDTAADPEVLALIQSLGLKPLPVEGTLYRSTYACAARAADGSPAGTAMLGLYARSPRSRSLFHRLDRDEVWHFYRGDPLVLRLLHPDGSSEEVVMGGDILRGQACQHVVRAGSWQAGSLLPGGRYALFGCTVAPGFTASCFEAGTPELLLPAYPDRREWIEELAVRGEDLSMPESAAFP